MPVREPFPTAGPRGPSQAEAADFARLGSAASASVTSLEMLLSVSFATALSSLRTFSSTWVANFTNFMTIEVFLKIHEMSSIVYIDDAVRVDVR